jgi:hypothetical protein
VSQWLSEAAVQTKVRFVIHRVARRPNRGGPQSHVDHLSRDSSRPLAVNKPQNRGLAITSGPNNSGGE